MVGGIAESAGIMQEVANGPVALTVHATLGLALIVTAIVLLVRAVCIEDRLVAVPATVGLTAIGGAFAAVAVAALLAGMTLAVAADGVGQAVDVLA